VEVYSTEEEQVAAIKKWWKSNGNALSLGILLALAVFFGWKLYQKKVNSEKDSASRLYQQLITTAMTKNITKDDFKTIAFVAKKLKTTYPGTDYADFASLFLAKSAVEAGHLSVAEKELKWALKNQKDAAELPAIKIRLARVMAEQGKMDEALALIDKAITADKKNDFKGIYESVKGDILIKKGNKSQAIIAYKSAYNDFKSKKISSPILKMKLSNLGVLVGEV